MGAVVSESSVRVVKLPEQSSRREGIARGLDDTQLQTLAQMIIDKEPSEIRSIVSSEPVLVRQWIALLKDQELRTAGPATIWHEALDHIRLSTLSPLKFAAE